MDNIRQAISRRYPELNVKIQSASKFSVTVPDRYRENVVQLISMVENLEVETDEVAKIVINEKTGSIVMGGPIKISPVVIAHEDLNVTIKNTDTVSQPNALAAGATTTVKGSEINVDQGISSGGQSFSVFKQQSSIESLVSVLNNLGVTPQDTIAILQLMKEAGAIKAKLEII